MLYSYYFSLCPVTLPWAGRQFYMHEFDLAVPSVPTGFEDYQPIVRQIVARSSECLGTPFRRMRKAIAYLTIDEKIVGRGQSQRKPGPHVDGCFIPAAQSWGHGGGWNHYCNNVEAAEIGRMPVIVASSVAGCRAWSGQFDTQPTECGDLSHIADQLGEGKVLPANHAFLLSPDCIHESMRFEQETKRSFLRIALPVGFSW